MLMYDTKGVTAMNRRRFLLTSAGPLTSPLAPGVWAVEPQTSEKRQIRFKRLRGADVRAPLVQATPDDAFYVHTYYDACPFSPSQRYLAATQLPFQDRAAVLGDVPGLVDRS